MYKTILIGLTLMFASCNWECHTVTEILACNADECRVKIETGHKVTVYDLVVVGDRVNVRMARMTANLWERSCPQVTDE